jgi:hypothetical protein
MRVFAVPRSIERSLEKYPRRFLNMFVVERPTGRGAKKVAVL